MVPTGLCAAWPVLAASLSNGEPIHHRSVHMRTPASIAGHPIHPMLVPIAIGGLILSFIFDIVCIATGSVEPWATVAYYTMIGGIVGALVAAIFGFIDMLSIPAGATKKVALTHMAINLTVVVLFIFNAGMRHADVSPGGTPFILSLVGIALLAVSGWLGGKMVYEAGVGVSGGPAEVPPRPANRRAEA
jgi:uncharacterized membrane protein